MRIHHALFHPAQKSVDQLLGRDQARVRLEDLRHQVERDEEAYQTSLTEGQGFEDQANRLVSANSRIESRRDRLVGFDRKSAKPLGAIRLMTGLGAGLGLLVARGNPELLPWAVGLAATSGVLTLIDRGLEQKVEKYNRSILSNNEQIEGFNRSIELRRRSLDSQRVHLRELQGELKEAQARADQADRDAAFFEGVLAGPKGGKIEVDDEQVIIRDVPLQVQA